MQCQAIKTTVYLLILTVLLHCNTCWADDWQLEKQKASVSIFSKKTDSGYKDILVKTTVEVNPRALVALLNDVAFSAQWIHNCIEVKILEDISPTKRLVNSFFKAPWPVKNRDMVTLSSTTISEHKVQIEISDRGDNTPHHPKYVRMQNMHGIWQAKSIENGKTEVSYTGGGNPGGSLPTFMANKELISSMFKTFQNLKEVILLDKYQAIEITD